MGSLLKWLSLAFSVIIIMIAPATLAQTSRQNAQSPGPPATKAAHHVKQYTIEQFLDTTSIFGSSFSANEARVMFTSNKSGIFNAYTVPVRGGEAVPLTHSTKESTFGIGYFPHDNRILYTYDRGGNENNHLYVMGTDGQEKDLTPGDKVKANFLKWTFDGDAFYYMTNERDLKFFDVYKMQTADYKRKLVYENTTGLQPADISNDEKYIAFGKPNTTSDSDVLLYAVAAKELKNITQHQGDIANAPQTFDVNSKWFYYTTDEDSEFAYISRYDLATGKKEVVEKAPWDIMYIYFSHNGKYRVVGINEDAVTRITVYDTATGKPIALPTFPQGEITDVDFSRSEKQMAFYFNGDRSPSNLHLLDLEGKNVVRLTDALNPAIDPKDLVEAQVVRYKSFDGLEIPALLYRPYQADAEAKAPAIVEVHGGPGGQSRHGYQGLMQYVVNHGYVVLMVNNRGSSGYGKTFFTADDGRHGHEPLWDCVEAKKYLSSLDYVDANRIGILGGSYGGYMVLAALTLQPNVFDVGVDFFGISNWIRTLESTPPYWESFKKALYKEIGDPVKDRAKLMEVSPLFHADNIRKPLMVLQGANDPRVIKPESDEIVAAVKKRGGIVEYIVFADEGHGFTKKKNEIAGDKAVLEFLDKYLRNKPAATAAKQ